MPARTLVQPTWWAAPDYAYTLGPEVATICALAGFGPEPEQQLLLDGTFGVDEQGKSAAFEVDVVAARRNLKTGFIVQCILGWLYVTEERKVMYTAHDLQAAQETWETVAGLIESTPSLAKQLKQTRGDRPGIVEGNGRWSIELDNPRRTVIFRTRGKNTGRALSGNKVVFDEGFAATNRQVGSVLPILGAVPDPQYVLASSAGMTDSHVLIDARDRGRAGGTDRQLYAEWGDALAGEGCELGAECDHARTAPGCVLDDEERWATIMPALGGRVRHETIRALRQTMSPAEFAREFMVWWDLDGTGDETVVDLADWQARRSSGGGAPDSVDVVAVSIAHDLSFSSIAAGVAARGGPLRLGAVDRRRGTAWLLTELVRLAKEHGVPVVLDGGGPASYLVTKLEDRGVTVEEAEMVDVLEGQARFVELVGIKGGLAHDDHPDLNDALLVAGWRSVGKRRAFAATRGDISMLEAAALALWHVDDGDSVYETRGMRSL